MTTNPSNTRKRSARKAAATTEATVTPIASKRKRSAKAEPVVETPAPRKRAAVKATPATGESVVEAHPLVGTSITIEQVDALATAHELASAATEAFELLVVELLQAGASPTHVGKAVGLGNSSIRRIGWRHGWSNA